MKYWINVAMLNDPLYHNAGQLLAEKDGKCVQWADLLVGVINAQGISDVTIVDVYPVNEDDEYLLINNWTFAPNGSLPIGQTPYLWVAAQLDEFGERVPGAATDAADNVGIAGKGNPAPPGWFANHATVKYHRRATDVDAYYDPSYGAHDPFCDPSPGDQDQRSGQLKWETWAIAGFGRYIPATIPNAYMTLAARKKRTGIMETVFHPRS